MLSLAHLVDIISNVSLPSRVITEDDTVLEELIGVLNWKTLVTESNSEATKKGSRTKNKRVDFISDSGLNESMDEKCMAEV